MVPVEGFLVTLQLELENKSSEGFKGISNIWTSKGKIVRLISLGDVFANGKELKCVLSANCNSICLTPLLVYRCDPS
jgi:hypothetical protein